MSTDRLVEIKARATAATPGPWKASTDICDCGGEYACGHGAFVDGLVLPVSHRDRPDGKYETWDFTYSEIIEFSDETRDFLVHSRSDIDWLIAEVEQLRARRDEQDAEIARIATDTSPAYAQLRTERDSARRERDEALDKVASLRRLHDERDAIERARMSEGAR